MVERHGKFGAFHVCKDHGTISIQNGSAVCTGAIFEAIKVKAENIQVKACGISQYLGEPAPDLEALVRQRVAAMGLHMDDLDLFVEGGSDAADDEPDHWINVRPW